MRHTKIIATLGPASSPDAVLAELIAAGVDIFRLNFSHGSHESHADLYGRVRRAAEHAGRTVAVLQDLSGPKIRTGVLKGGVPVALHEGRQIRIAVGDGEGDEERIFTSYEGLPRSVEPGSKLLLDDGRIELQVVRTDGAEIVATVVDGGLLAEHKGINAPGVTLPVAPVTAKDIDDLIFGLRLGVDMVAVSFVRRASDLDEVRTHLATAGRTGVPVIAKLERPEALAHLFEILGSCDGVMVARGDLGLEMPLETVPRAQREITMAARTRGIPVIVATQVLESMRTEPRPTRAEVSDAAKAVDDGVDAIMLAGETAIGAYPVRAVRTLDAVIREAEKVANPVAITPEMQGASGHEQAICEAAVVLAQHSGADAIIAITQKGNTARHLATFRSQVPIYAATPKAEVARDLTLFRGIVPLVVSADGDIGSSYMNLARRLRDEGSVPTHATIVFVNVAADLTKVAANFVKLLRLD